MGIGCDSSKLRRKPVATASTNSSTRVNWKPGWADRAATQGRRAWRGHAAVDAGAGWRSRRRAGRGKQLRCSSATLRDRSTDLQAHASAAGQRLAQRHRTPATATARVTPSAASPCRKPRRFDGWTWRLVAAGAPHSLGRAGPGAAAGTEPGRCRGDYATAARTLDKKRLRVEARGRAAMATVGQALVRSLEAQWLVGDQGAASWRGPRAGRCTASSKSVNPPLCTA